MASLKDTVVMGDLNVTDELVVGGNVSLSQDLNMSGHFNIYSSTTEYFNEMSWSPRIYASDVGGTFENEGDLILQSGNRFENNIHFLTSSGGYVTNLTMFLQHDGKVGIGTDNPLYQLDVNGDANVAQGLTVGGDLQAPTADIAQLTTGGILPSGTGIDIGSELNRFRAIYVDEAYLSTNTLYIGDTPIMGTEQDTILIKADLDQSIAVRTKGIGQTTLMSEKGVSVSTNGMNADVEMTASGVGSKVRMTADDDIELIGSTLRLQGPVVATNSLQVAQDLTVSGNLTINGSVLEVETETVRVTDNLLHLNAGETGSGVTAVTSGIEVDRGNQASYQFVFDETDDMFKVGMVGDLETVSTRDWVYQFFTEKGHGHEAATTSTSGFMSAADKSKLNGVEAGAEVNAVTSVAGKTGAVSIAAGDVQGLTDAATTTVSAIRSGTTKADVSLSNVRDVAQVSLSGDTMTGRLTVDSSTYRDHLFLKRDTTIAEINPSTGNNSGASPELRFEGTVAGYWFNGQVKAENGFYGDGSNLTGTSAMRATGTTKADVGLSSVRNVVSYSQVEADNLFVAKGVFDLGTL